MSVRSTLGRALSRLLLVVYWTQSTLALALVPPASASALPRLHQGGPYHGDDDDPHATTGITTSIATTMTTTGTATTITAIATRALTKPQPATAPAAYGATTTSVEADPLMVSASNFRLQAASPAINAGVDVSLTSDFTGRGVRGLPDIGAYEFAQGGIYRIPSSTPSGATRCFPNPNCTRR